MFFEIIVVVSLSIILMTLLVVRYVRRYAPENIVIVPLIALFLSLYIPFAINNISIPLYLQILILIFDIIIPACCVTLQYNNIILSRKILYYKMKYNFKICEYTKTIDLISKLVSLEGRRAEYLYILGQCYKHIGDFINSRDSFALAIELDEKDYKSYYELGLALDETNKKDSAIVMFNNALKLKPDFYEAQEALGICLTSKGEFEEAVKIYRKALRYHPDSYELYYNIAMIESELGNYEEAIQAFEEAGKIKYDLYTAFYNLGKLYYSEGKYDEAIGAFTRILNSTTYGPKGYYNLAIVYSKKGEYDKAMSTLEYSMELDSKYIEKADSEYIFNPFRNRIEDYKKAKEKIKIKEFQKHNFMDQSFKIFKLKEKYIEENDEEVVEIKNHA